MNKIKRITGANGKPFNKEYWKKIYGDGTDVDGTFNAYKHARYIYNLLSLMEIPVLTLGDIGFGKGILLHEFSKAFQPQRIIAVDPSIEMIKELSGKDWIQQFDIAVFHSDLKSLDIKYLKNKPLDLAICNSVFQYIQNETDFLFKKLASISNYVYFTVPTKNDYERMEKDIPFTDPYAYSRTKEYYYIQISKYFNIVSFNLLESKLNIKDSRFCDELYRF